MEALGVTGPARNLLEFARYADAGSVSDTQIDVRIVTFARRSAAASHQAGVETFAAACQAAGHPVAIVPERRAFDRTIIAAVDALIDELCPDVIETHSVKSHFLVARSRAARRARWIAFHHGYTTTDLKVRIYNQLDRWSLPRADVVVTTCRDFAAALTARGVDDRRTIVLHNAVELELPSRWSLSRRDQPSASGARLALSVGRLSHEKGHDVLIAAWSRLSKTSSIDATLRIVGDGPARSRLERGVRREALAVRFEGHQADVAPFYRSCDLFVLPSRSEGSPNALLEAMAVGCPIVATAVGGVPEIVEDERNALLVAPDDPRALATAMSRLLADDRLARRLGRAARETAAQNFAPAARAARLASLYARLVDPCAS